MNGPIAQLVALTCHGNAVIHGIASDDFFPDNTTCRFCDRIEFVELRTGLLGKVKEHLVASTPDEWFQLIAAEATTGLELRYEGSKHPHLDDRMSAGFVGGGGHWSVTAFTDSGSSIWMSRWKVWNQQAAENRIWRVTYAKVGTTRAKRPTTRMELGPCVARLRHSLAEITPFAWKNDCSSFALRFEETLRALDGGSSPDVYHTDLAPRSCLSKEANAVLAACQGAWVFGGMGSWNDMYFEGADHDEYRRLSDNLFRAVIAAIVAATNTSLENGSSQDG